MLDGNYSDGTFWGVYEATVSDSIKGIVDGFEQFLRAIEMKIMTHVMIFEFKIPQNGELVTIEGLKKVGSALRREMLSGLLYNDALWRLETIPLMVKIGLLNVAYSSMRSAIDTILTAFIIERDDGQALRFLDKKQVKLSLAKKLIPSGQSDEIKAMKDAFSLQGVHSRFESFQLSSLFSPNRMDKIRFRTNPRLIPSIKDGFTDAVKTCISDAFGVGALLLSLQGLPVVNSSRENA